MKITRHLCVSWLLLVNIAWALPQPYWLSHVAALSKMQVNLRDDMLLSDALAQTYVSLQQELRWLLQVRELTSAAEVSQAIVNVKLQLQSSKDFFIKFVESHQLIGQFEALQAPDLIVILGCNKEELDHRLAVAVTLAKQHPKARLLLSGAGRRLFFNEAKYMQDYLLRQHIDGRRLQLEPYSLDTVGNAVFSQLTLMQQHLVPRRVVLVTSAFHAYRAYYLFKQSLPTATSVVAVMVHSLSPHAWQRYVDNELRHLALAAETVLQLPAMANDGTGRHTTRRLQADACSIYQQLFIAHDLYRDHQEIREHFRGVCEVEDEFV